MTRRKAISAKIEAILFACGDPVEISKLSAYLHITQKECKQYLNELQNEYQNYNAGIELLFLENHVQLATRKEYEEDIKLFLKEKKDAALSPAAMETLAVVAYNEPVTRGFVEEVRGVNSNYLINSLLEKELISEVGRLQAPGKPVLYGTTVHFLRCFGLHSLKELPPLEKQNMQMKEDEIE